MSEFVLDRRAGVVRAAETHVDQATYRRRGTGLIARDEARAGTGFTLITPHTQRNVYLVGMDGREAHRWEMSTRPGRHAVILPNGNLGYNGYLPGQLQRYAVWSLWSGGLFQEVDPQGRIVWEHRDPSHHHDCQWLANGNLLYGCAEPLPADVAARIVGGSRLRDLDDGKIYGDVVREVNRGHEIVWEWKAWEHLAPEDYPIAEIFDRFHWPMINGVNLTRAGQVLMSLRTTSGVIAVDRAKGGVAWRIGRDLLSFQHTPVELDNGRILIFDNGNLRPGNSTPYSRVIEVDPHGPSIAWEYTDPAPQAFFSAYMGSAQRLANGNTHICESATGRLFDVTPRGEIVWEYVIPYFGAYDEPEILAYTRGEHNRVFRSYRYTPQQLPWLATGR